MKKIFALLLLSLTLVSTFAQIRYKSGNLNINEAKESNLYNFTINKWLGLYWTSKDKNFFQLDLSSANPRLAGTGNKIVFFNTQDNIFNKLVSGEHLVYVDLESQKMTYGKVPGLAEIMKLNPVSYRPNFQLAPVDNTFTDAGTISKDSIAIFPTIQDLMKPKMGFKPDDLYETIPNVVEIDENGRKLINYDAIIPILVQSIQDLNDKVSLQYQLIEQLMTEASVSKRSSSTLNKILGCSPNPATDNITISLQFEAGVQDVELMISDAYGNVSKRISIGYGMSSISEDISGLNSGVHIVTLLVNGAVVDSYRLLVN